MSSGDVGYFDEDGLLYVSGRDDEMIVSGGENVFPAEVEDLISGHEQVVEATAIGVEDKEWGHRLRAFVVMKEGADLDEDTVKHYVRDHLARYKVPREVIFLDELPRNPTGKILKRELRELDVDDKDTAKDKAKDIAKDAGKKGEGKDQAEDKSGEAQSERSPTRSPTRKPSEATASHVNLRREIEEIPP